jgi:hypothetical protein
MNLLKNPVILIPGFAGSKLLDNTPPPPPRFSKIKSSPTYVCRPTKNGFINLNLFDSDWQNRYILKYDKTSKEFHLDDEIEVFDFGGVNGIQNLCEDCSQLDSLFNTVFKKEIIADLYNYRYYDDMIEVLKRKGWIVGETLYGAPYDFRKIMITEYLENYMENVKALIEKAYENTNNSKVVIVAHSIGCMLMYLLFVEYVSNVWKKKYIKSFLSIAGPYGGASISLKTILSGVPKLKLLKERYYNIMQHSSGLALALPNVLGYDKDDFIIENKSLNKVYNIHTYHEILPDVTYNVVEKYVKPLLPSFTKNTDVNTYIITTTQSQTESGYVYDTIDTTQAQDPFVCNFTTGDAIVPEKSLKAYQRLSLGYNNFKFIDITDNVEHTSILWSKQIFDLVIKEATQ